MIAKSKFVTGLLILTILAITSCAKIDVFEKNTPVPQHSWGYNFTPHFDFDITDTSSPYNLYVVLRHTDAYHYNNIWLNIGLQIPGDTLKHQRLELLLGSDARGWEGTGIDDIWEVRKSITNGPMKFKKPGKYFFSVGQIMRENPLSNIMSVGIRIEKVK